MSYQLLTCSHLLAYLHSYINLTSLHMVNLYLHHSQAPGQPMSMFAPTVSQWFHRWVSWNSLFAVVLGSQKVPIGYPIYFWDGEEKGIYITDTSLYIHPFFCFKTGALGLFALRGLWAGPFWRSTLRSDPGELKSFDRVCRICATSLQFFKTSGHLRWLERRLIIVVALLTKNQYGSMLNYWRAVCWVICHWWLRFVVFYSRHIP